MRLKRLLDLGLSLPALLIFAPIMFGIAMAILIRMGRPVLFVHTRPGLDGKPFVMRKFRTMMHTSALIGPESDADRITTLGHFLRSTSLDELPELWSVIRGDMSLVGPRPLLMEYLPLYTDEHSRRHSVKPGLTGWAQINGRNAVSWEEKFAMDVWYVDHQSLALDIKIILKTFAKVIQREGVSAANEATMPRYTGPATPRREATPMDRE